MQELRQMMHDFSESNKKISDQEVEEAMKEADTNSNGEIDFYVCSWCVTHITNHQLWYRNLLV
jgi:Ca2+-binding EF-hand superfamily protein